MNAPVEVLLVEDNPGDADLVRERLADCPATRFQVTDAGTLSEALARFRHGHVDVVLLDLSLPDSQGLSTLWRVREAAPDVAVVVLTGLDDEDVGLLAMRAGAQDYLTKGRLDGPLLARALRYAVERKHAEGELRRAEARLREAEKMEAVGFLAGGVAHHFNNLMAVVTGFTDLALGRLPPEDPGAELLRKARRAGDRAAELTQQLLAVSRRQLLAVMAMDLNPLVRNMLPALREVLGPGIEVVMDLDPALGKVKADPMQMQQVVLHLARNARDAMPRGGRLTVRTADAEPPADVARGVPAGRHVMLGVADTGCGMTAEVQAHVFEPFFTTKGVSEGTGLGLAIAHGIIHQMGGHITFDSTPGEGSTFRLYLQHAEPPPPAEAAGFPSARAGGKTAPGGDDEPGKQGVFG